MIYNAVQCCWTFVGKLQPCYVVQCGWFVSWSTGSLRPIDASLVFWISVDTELVGALGCTVLVVDLHVGAHWEFASYRSPAHTTIPPAQNRSLLNSHIRDASKVQYGEMTKWQLNWTCWGGGRRVEKGNSRAECADGQLEHSASPVNCHYPPTAVCFIQLHCVKESAKSERFLLYHLFVSRNSTVGYWHCDPFHVFVFDHAMRAENSAEPLP